MALEIKISDSGNLYVKRRGEWTKQVCPHKNNDGYELPCGDECPLFGEPIYTKGKSGTLALCGGGISGEEAIINDERTAD